MYVCIFFFLRLMPCTYYMQCRESDTRLDRGKRPKGGGILLRHFCGGLKNGILRGRCSLDTKAVLSFQCFMRGLLTQYLHLVLLFLSFFFFL